MGLVLWSAAIGSTFLTKDVITLETIVMIGSFLVPVTAVVWYLDHEQSAALTTGRIVGAFAIAGTVSLLASSLLEHYLVGYGTVSNFKIGLIEEFTKAALIVAVAWGIRVFPLRDGMALGAAVGFGFAALESSGYALASFYPIGGRRFTHALDNVLLTELARGVLAPFGHGMWTALVGGVIFAAVARRKWLLGAAAIVAAYLLVSALHGAFDSIDGVKGYVIISLIGLVPLVLLWRNGRPPAPRAQPSEEVTATVGTSAG
jgi:RsiW-degrading membrane proteinase PrsW (M82 family)